MPNIIKQEEKPNPIQKLGNNTYYFNYNIKPIFITLNDSKTTTEGWEFIQVYLQGQPNYYNCVKAIIREYVTQEEEFDLINGYNKSILLNQKDSKEINNYKNYLNLIEDIKTNIQTVFKNEIFSNTH